MSVNMKESHMNILSSLMKDSLSGDSVNNPNVKALRERIRQSTSYVSTYASTDSERKRRLEASLEKNVYPNLLKEYESQKQSRKLKVNPEWKTLLVSLRDSVIGALPLTLTSSDEETMNENDLNQILDYIKKIDYHSNSKQILEKDIAKIFENSLGNLVITQFLKFTSVLDMNRLGAYIISYIIIIILTRIQSIQKDDIKSLTTSLKTPIIPTDIAELIDLVLKLFELETNAKRTLTEFNALLGDSTINVFQAGYALELTAFHKLDQPLTERLELLNNLESDDQYCKSSLKNVTENFNIAKDNINRMI